ncbi:hypothetical protein BH09BAC5_BH09BAC5_09530 [soil metagenome]
MILEQLPKDQSGRYSSVDIFRGVAIFTMLAANSAAESLAAPHHFLFRIYGSFAAPIFIFLAGFMVGIGYKKHSLVYFIRRGLEVILVGALIDVLIWRIIPFTTFDVLYLTGLGIPIAAFTLKLKTPLRIFLCLLFFVLGPLLQHFFYYESGVHEFSLIDFSGAQFPDGVKWWLKSWLFDGWFPVFPWMGFIMAGTLVFTHGEVIVKKSGVFLSAGIIFFLGGLLWIYFHRSIEEREGYSELFYPPGIAYLCAATGAILIGVSVLKYLKPVFGLQLLRYLGSCSLFIYIFHSALIYFVLDNYFVELNLENYILLYVCFAAVNIFVAWLIFEWKKKEGWKRVPKFLRFIFGG